MHALAAELFQEAWHRRLRRAIGLVVTSQACGPRIFLSVRPTGLNRDCWSPARLAFSTPPRHRTHVHRYGNVDPSSIDYAFRPRLRIRLTLGGMTLPRKPWVYGDADSHCVSRYSCPHTHSDILQESSRSPFAGSSDAPLPRPTRARAGQSRLRYHA